MHVITHTGHADTIIAKSRFLCTLYRINSPDHARDLIAEHRKTYWDASHNCTAYITGVSQGSSDDGEPAGTAGAPMLSVLTGANVTDILAVVTRYFGGTKLGAGGLVRAYGHAVTAALNNTPLARVVTLDRLVIIADYQCGPAVESALRDRGETLLDVDWGHDMTLTVATEAPADVTALVADLSSGSALVENDGTHRSEISL